MYNKIRKKNNKMASKKTHCPQGHPYSDDNTRMSINPSGTYSRKCKTCAKPYSVWSGMISRCSNVNDRFYKNYGGRGISVAEEWNDYNTFKEWMFKSGYDYGLSIERINVNGNYEPSNCCWATMKEQANNKTNSRFITAFGVTKTLQQWSDKMGIGYKTIAYRIKSGWQPEIAMTVKPTMGRRKVIIL